MGISTLRERQNPNRHRITKGNLRNMLLNLGPLSSRPNVENWIPLVEEYGLCLGLQVRVLQIVGRGHLQSLEKFPLNPKASPAPLLAQNLAVVSHTTPSSGNSSQSWGVTLGFCPQLHTATPKFEGIFQENLKNSQMQSQTGRKLSERLVHIKYVRFGALQGGFILFIQGSGKTIWRFTLLLRSCQ